MEIKNELNHKNGYFSIKRFIHSLSHSPYLTWGNTGGVVLCVSCEPDILHLLLYLCRPFFTALEQLGIMVRGGFTTRPSLYVLRQQLSTLKPCQSPWRVELK